ncbi:MAG TPA: Gfo/Idh/MocA family oxidoreductase [Candidatus Brocadiia bacterium]|nr:Gfo/Idh/MocA family oxidoreductase [Candidatus Brocadiia bacterium]
MPPHSLLTRRTFLRAAASAAFAPYVITSTALGKGGVPPASERITMGCIGTGNMGMGDMMIFLGHGDCRVVAVCDVDAARARDAAQRTNLRYRDKGCAVHRDFRELLARKDIDAVCIATPDHWHAIPTIMAAKAGKDIFCQKPLSLTIEEGRAMSDAVKRYRRVFQCGSQQRSSWEFRFACELVRNGRIGKLHTIRTGLYPGPRTGIQKPQPVPPGFDYDMWLGQAPCAPYTPSRCHGSFRYIFDYSGGNMTDFGAHHNDIAQWGNGTELTGPVEIEGRGDFPKEGLFNTAVHFHVEYTYADGTMLICDDHHPNGVLFIGTEGSVYVDRGVLRPDPPSLIRSEIGPGELHLYKSPGHHLNFLECARSRKETVAPAEVAHRSATICHLGNMAMLLGRKLRWDPGRERFVNDPEADRLIGRPMRSPWTLT